MSGVLPELVELHDEARGRTEIRFCDRSQLLTKV
jgi:hypothetical protein